MRFKLSLQIDSSIAGNLLPINYQYPLSSWMYGVIAKSNTAYSTWLHDNGFLASEGNKCFKLFTFSNLKINHAKLIGDRLLLLSDTADLYLSFLPEKSTEAFIKGLFLEKDFSIGDKESRVHFRVQSIEMLPSPFLGKEGCFKTLSPITITFHQESYLSPEAKKYGQLLVNNLKEKYRAYYQQAFTGNPDFEFKLFTQPKSKLITIKAGNQREETKVRGYLFTFGLQADPKLLEIMYEAGAGEKGSLGFGMIESVEP
ncbi:MAG: CRISPR-associated endoribonuclease Cas6 [Tannerellaceae bacterium]|jgi:CRISPR-associated endoribonuclease Cas6|nr:CRISPR-associated endoribonuclease Cas6 [Tannerellaceae bacterium]